MPRRSTGSSDLSGITLTIIREDGQTEQVDAIPVCGVDHCAICNACLWCGWGNPCKEPGGHIWERDERHWP